MKEVLETIPVWDALKKNDECLICSLMKRAEEDALNYYLGPAIMVPEIRVEINKVGYCDKHWSMLSLLNKAQPLALSLDTYYEENKGFLKQHFDKVSSATNVKKAIKAFEGLNESVKERSKGCLICSYMEKRLSRYCATVAVLFKEDSDFKRELLKSKGFCIHHTLDLYKYSKEYLQKDELLEFLKFLSSSLDSNLDRVQGDIYWLTQKYKSENKDKPWNGCEDAHKRGVQKLVGSSIINS